MKKVGLLVILASLLFIIMVAAKAAGDPGPNIEAKAVRKVPPVYPPIAKRKRIGGKVIVGLQVGSDGAVTNTEFLEGNSLFKPASIEAAKQWTFQKSASGITGHIVFNFQVENE